MEDEKTLLKIHRHLVGRPLQTQQQFNAFANGRHNKGNTKMNTVFQINQILTVFFLVIVF